METIDITQRLLLLEAKVALLEDAEQAAQALLLTTAAFLRRHNPRIGQEWLAALRSDAAFALAAHDKQPPRKLPALIAAMQAVLDGP